MIGVGIDLFRYGGGGGPAFTVSNSLIFTAASSQRGVQTLSSPTATNKWTFSTWFKIVATGTNNMLLSAGATTSNFAYIKVNASNQIEVFTGTGGGIDGYVYTGAVVTSADTWYHLTVKYDGTAAASSRITVYLDGSPKSLTVNTEWPTTSTYLNTAIAHGLGVRNRAGTFDQYLNGKLSETYLIDGQALDYSGFYDGSPVLYTGTFGNNGFYLDYKDGTSTTTLGYDVSGNDNHWTLVNMTTANQSTDVPGSSAPPSLSPSLFLAFDSSEASFVDTGLTS